MAVQKEFSNGPSRNTLAYAILIFSGTAITLLAVTAIIVDTKNTLTILNVVLPVVASWVGTILAFYFGRENFEAANERVQALVERLTPEQRANAPITSVMRPLKDMVTIKIPQGKSESEITLAELRRKFGGKVSRLPITNADNHPLYMIHESRIDGYLLGGGQEADTLSTFLSNQKETGLEFGPGKGFVVVSERSTIATAKDMLERTPTSQDIFVTQDGSADKPLTGWISNVRLAKFVDA